jgi:hypothetical protein
MSTPEGKTVTQSAVNTIYQNNQIDIREQLEPDRVAFAVVEHIKKLAVAPTQKRGASMASIWAKP